MKKSNNITLIRFFHLSLILAISALPFGNFLAHFTAPALVGSILLLVTRKIIRPTWKELLFFSLAFVYYLFYFISWYNYPNAEARFQIELKMGFVLVPFIFLFTKMPLQLIRVLMRFFIIMLAASTIYCAIRAIVNVIQGIDAGEAFFSSSFSAFLHPSYFSMYIVFAFWFLISQWQKKLPLFRKKWINIAAALSLAFINFILASKMGWFTLLVVILWLAGAEFIRRKKTVQLLAFVAFMFLVSFAAYKFVKPVNEKINNLFSARDISKIDKTTTESSSVRMLVWASASEITQRHFMKGVGSGLAKDSLLKVYEKNGYTGALHEELNAHNQFIESQIAFGLPGLLAIIALFIAPILLLIRTISAMDLLFPILFAINCSVESMLQNQAGAVFFILFYSILFIGRKNRQRSAYKTTTITAS